MRQTILQKLLQTKMGLCSRIVGHLQVILVIMCLMADIIHAQSACKLLIKFNKKQKSFNTCRSLGVQRASISWSLFPHNHTLEVAFVGQALSPSGWVGWGINLGSNPVMKGANTLIAFTAANGSNLLTYKLTDQTYNGLLPSCSPIDLVILDKAVEITGKNVKIFATLQLEAANQTSVVNHIWNRGSGMNEFRPLAHDPTDIRGALRINMARGTVLSVESPHQKLKTGHGILNTLGWGFLLPLGALTARYLRPFEAESETANWFYSHIILQSSGYILGCVGWATGMKLGSYSKGIIYPQHRCIGIIIFSLASLQILSLLFRPNKYHQLRIYWNIYHHTLGYTILILAVINNFHGQQMLKASEVWRTAYIVGLASGGGIAMGLEAATWAMYMRRKSIYPTRILDRKYASGCSASSREEFEKSRAFSWSVY